MLLISSAVVAAALPALAMAASLDVGATVQGAPTVQVGGSGVNVNAGTNVNVNAGANVTTNGAANATTGGTAASQMPGVTVSGNGSLTILPQAAGAPSTLTSSTAVETDADFAAYAQAAMQQDTRLKEVDADNTSVTVKYAEPATILGVFSVTMTATAKVAADGSVNISYPWYSFMATTASNDTTLRAALANNAAAVVGQQTSSASEGATSTTNANISLTANEKARILDGMRVALEGTFGANGSATTAAQ